MSVANASLRIDGRSRRPRLQQATLVRFVPRLRSNIPLEMTSLPWKPNRIATADAYQDDETESCGKAREFFIQQ